jgi:hypothetical protein
MPRKECKMKLLKFLLICFIAAGLFCAGCKKESSTPEDPNAQVTLSQEQAAT